MESELRCPACRTRTRPGVAWCPVCYTDLTRPEPEPVAAPAAVAAGVEGAAVPSSSAGPQGEASRGSRRARREELDQLTAAMLTELAASQPQVTLPGPVQRVMSAIGLAPGESRGRRGVGIVVICAGLVLAFTLVSWIAGLVL